MNAPRAHRDLLADRERIRALLREGADGVEQPAGTVGALTIGGRGNGTLHRHAHAQALGGARELQVVDHPRADGGEAIGRLAGAKLDLLRPDHGDDLPRRHVLDAGAIEAELVAAAVAEQQVRGAQEGGHEPRARPRVELVGAADFEQAALVHHADAVRHREGLVLVVRDEDGGDAELLLDPSDRAPELLADFGVERAEGLVEQQHLGPVGERARDRDALLLAARELGRQAFVHALEGDELQQFPSAGQPIAVLHAPDAERELDVVGDAHVAEQGVVLEHEADAAVARRDAGDVAPVQRYPAVVDLDQARDRAQQRALAAARGAEQHQEFALLDLDRDVVDDRQRLIPLGDLVECDGHGAKPAGPSGRLRGRLVCGRFAGQSRPGNKSVTESGTATEFSPGAARPT